MAVVLMQKRDEYERPITFFSWTIRDATLKYNIIEKQSLALVKALKDFQVYILHSHTLAYVPNAVVKDVLVQTNLEGRRGKWIAALLEYYVKIKPTKLVKGQGLANLMVESNLHALDINLIIAMSDENEEGSSIQEKIKKIYDRKAKADKFQLEEVVLKWDARNEDKGKHGKFENLWKDPFKISAYRCQNAFLLKEMSEEECLGGPVNGRLQKRYHF
eukprot:PITA_03287